MQSASCGVLLGIGRERSSGWEGESRPVGCGGGGMLASVHCFCCESIVVVVACWMLWVRGAASVGEALGTSKSSLPLTPLGCFVCAMGRFSWLAVALAAHHQPASRSVAVHDHHEPAPCPQPTLAPRPPPPPASAHATPTGGRPPQPFNAGTTADRPHGLRRFGGVDLKDPYPTTPFVPAASRPPPPHPPTPEPPPLPVPLPHRSAVPPPDLPSTEHPFRRDRRRNGPSVPAQSTSLGNADRAQQGGTLSQLCAPACLSAVAVRLSPPHSLPP